MDEDEWRDLPVRERRERLLRAEHPDDDLPALITVRQLVRIQQIIGGTLTGDDLARSLSAAERYLIAVVSESGRSAGALAYTAADAWEALDRLPLVPPPES